MNAVTWNELISVLTFLLTFAVAIIQFVKFVLDLIDKHDKKK